MFKNAADSMKRSIVYFAPRCRMKIAKDTTRPVIRSRDVESALRLAFLILVAGCIAGNPTQQTAFELKTKDGPALLVRVNGYGITISDAKLVRLVKTGMERQIRTPSEAAARVSVSDEENRMVMIWRVTGRPGRPERTIVSVELFEGDRRINSAFSVISGTDMHFAEFELMAAVSRLTLRVLKDNTKTKTKTSDAPAG